MKTKKLGACLHTRLKTKYCIQDSLHTLILPFYPLILILLSSLGVCQSGRSPEGRSSRGSDELVGERAALSSHHLPVYNSEFGAGIL